MIPEELCLLRLKKTKQTTNKQKKTKGCWAGTYLRQTCCCSQWLNSLNEGKPLNPACRFRDNCNLSAADSFSASWSWGILSNSKRGLAGAEQVCFFPAGEQVAFFFWSCWATLIYAENWCSLLRRSNEKFWLGKVFQPTGQPGRVRPARKLWMWLNWWSLGWRSVPGKLVTLSACDLQHCWGMSKVTDPSLSCPAAGKMPVPGTAELTRGGGGRRKVLVLTWIVMSLDVVRHFYWRAQKRGLHKTSRVFLFLTKFKPVHSDQGRFLHIGSLGFSTNRWV